MKSIQSFNKEREFDYGLEGVYKECWNRLIRAASTLTMEDMNKLSNPFLVKCLPAYRKASKKVLFVGQETNGWDSFKVTLETFSRNKTEEHNSEDIIEYLQWMYEDFRFQRKYDHTPFWKGLRSIHQAIVGEDDSFLHTQLVRFDLNCQRPPEHIEELLQKEYNVLPMEIDVLNPDVIIFLTGPYYDDRIRETYRDTYVRGDQLGFLPIEGFKGNELTRLSHPALPYHTYRTYHPGYSLRKEQDVFLPIKSVLASLINESTKETRDEG